MFGAVNYKIKSLLIYMYPTYPVLGGGFIYLYTFQLRSYSTIMTSGLFVFVWNLRVESKMRLKQNVLQ